MWLTEKYLSGIMTMMGCIMVGHLRGIGKQPGCFPDGDHCKTKYRAFAQKAAEILNGKRKVKPNILNRICFLMMKHQCRRWDAMRLFIAVNFDQETKRNMIAVQGRLRKAGPGNFSRPENLHLTLAFLGEVMPGRVAAVKQAMEQTSVPDLILTFDHMGCFQRDGGDVWWIGLAENRALLEMQKELCGYLSAAGFKLESSRFAPHITLARKIRQTEKPDCKTLFGASFTTHADTITLMLSERVNGRLVYTEHYSVGRK
jgi:2'-5' RNA ligase